MTHNDSEFVRLHNIFESIYNTYRKDIKSCPSAVQGEITKRFNQITSSRDSAKKINNFLKNMIDKQNHTVRKSSIIYMIDNLIQSSNTSVRIPKYHNCVVLIISLLSETYKDLNIIEYFVAVLFHYTPRLIPAHDAVMKGIEKEHMMKNIHPILRHNHRAISRMYFSLLGLKINEFIPPFTETGAQLAYRFIYNSRCYNTLSPNVIRDYAEQTLYEFFMNLYTPLNIEWSKNKNLYKFQMNEILEYYKKPCHVWEGNIVKTLPECDPLIGIVNDIINGKPEKIDIHVLSEKSKDFTNSIFEQMG